MKRLIATGLMVAAAINLWAQAPEMFRYQGRLVDGTNLVNATVPMSFKLYDAQSGGTRLYEDSNSVLVVDGLYSTYIGDDTVFGSLTNALTNAMVYLELTVNGETLSPRERLVSVPYSLSASEAGLPTAINRIAGLEGQTNKWNTAYLTATNTAAALTLKLDVTGANLTNQFAIDTNYCVISGFDNGITNSPNGVYFRDNRGNGPSWTRDWYDSANSEWRISQIGGNTNGWYVYDGGSYESDSLTGGDFPWSSSVTWSDTTHVSPFYTNGVSVAWQFRNNLGVPSTSDVNLRFTALEDGEARAFALLSNKANVVYNTEVLHRVPVNVTTNVNETIVSFIFDDGWWDGILPPIFTNAGVPACLALIMGNTGGNISAVDMQNNHGWEMLGHSATHSYVAVTGTPEQITAELVPPLAWAASHGIVMKNFVCPGNLTSEKFRQEIAKYYRSAFGDGGGYNIQPVFQYYLKRNGLAGRSLNELIAVVTNAPSNNGTWIVFYDHSLTMNSTSRVVLASFLGYLGSNNIPVLTVDKALDRCGNVVQVGDYTTTQDGQSPSLTPHFAVGANGSIDYGPTFPCVWLGAGVKVSYYSTNSITNWPDKVESVLIFNTADGATMGYPYPGKLTTDRMSGNSGTGLSAPTIPLYMQRQKLEIYNADTVLRRRWTSSGWSGWTTNAF